MKISEKECLDDIVMRLFIDGMLWGEELEWYIKKSMKDIIEIQNEEHYFELENYILDRIEKKKQNLVRVIDLKYNKKYIFESAVKMEKELGISSSVVYRYKKLKTDGIYKKRYEISIGNITIEEFKLLQYKRTYD